MALTKTNAVVADWAQIAAAGIRESSHDCSAEYSTTLGITVCHDSANPHANGVLTRIECRMGSNDEDWVLLQDWRTAGGTANTIDVDDTSSGTTLKISATANFETKMDKYFVKDQGTIADSEVVVNNGFSSNDYVTTLDNLANAKDSADDVYDIVEEYQIRLPDEASTVRIVTWNDDADCTVVTRIVASRVTAIS